MISAMLRNQKRQEQRDVEHGITPEQKEAERSARVAALDEVREAKTKAFYDAAYALMQRNDEPQPSKEQKMEFCAHPVTGTIWTSEEIDEHNRFNADNPAELIDYNEMNWMDESEVFFDGHEWQLAGESVYPNYGKEE